MAREAFFLPAEIGYRFCLYTPAFGGTEKAVLIYIHPFAEELNKTRRMVALQVKSIAEAGYSVLQIDLLGCGDSSGDFGDASWDAWLNDVELAYQYIRQRSKAPIWLWGLRAGCLIAASVAPRLPEKVNFLFWQPMISGQVVLQQFLRLAAAGALTDEGGGKGVVSRLKVELAAGSEVEVAGYRLSPLLTNLLAVAEAKPLMGEAINLIWLEISSRENPEISASTATQLENWRNAGHQVELQIVSGPSFWQAAEIELAPALLDATLAVLEAAR
jgi:exosortase A-associated hydrolase 2